MRTIFRRLLIGFSVIVLGLEAVYIVTAIYMWLHILKLDVPLGIAIIVFAVTLLMGTLVDWLRMDDSVIFQKNIHGGDDVRLSQPGSDDE